MLPVKRKDWSLVLRHESSARALVELVQSGKAPSGANLVLPHPLEAFNGMQGVTTVSREHIPPKLFVPVGQRRRELLRPVEATAVGDHDHLLARVAQAGQHWMAIVAQPLRLNMGHDLVEDVGGAILDRTHDPEQPPAGDPAPGAILPPCLAFERCLACALALAQRARGEARALGFAPPAGPGEGEAPEDGFIFIEPNDLTPAGPVLKGSEFERRPCQLSGGGSEPPCGPAVADVLFF